AATLGRLPARRGTSLEGILSHDDQAPPVGRPREVVDPFYEARHPAATAVSRLRHVDLRLFVFVLPVLDAAEIREASPVTREARRIAVIRGIGEGLRLPFRAAARILGERDLEERVRIALPDPIRNLDRVHEAARIGRHLERADDLEPHHVLGHHAALSGSAEVSFDRDQQRSHHEAGAEKRACRHGRMIARRDDEHRAGGDHPGTPMAIPSRRLWCYALGMGDPPHKVTYVTLASNEEANAAFEDAARVVNSELGETHPNFIDGLPVGYGRPTFDDVSPTDPALVIGRFPRAGAGDVARAVDGAKAAFPAWSGRPWRERVAILGAAGEATPARRAELAALMTIEVGKNRLEAMGDAEESADLLRYYCGQMEDADGFDRPLGRLLPGEETRSLLRP